MKSLQQKKKEKNMDVGGIILREHLSPVALEPINAPNAKQDGYLLMKHPK